MIADAIQPVNEEIDAASCTSQLRVARGYRNSCFIVEEADNLIKIVAGPFASSREAMEVLRTNAALAEDLEPETNVFARILSRSGKLAELLQNLS